MTLSGPAVALAGRDRRRAGRGGKTALTFGLALTPAVAQAHAFGQIYTLPVPFWLYAWGAMAALLLSFLVVAWFALAGDARQPHATGGRPSLDEPPGHRVRLPRLVAPALQAMAALALLLCVASGLLGTQNAYHNLSMTLFWVGFVLAFVYLTALAGNLYGIANPWRALVAALGRCRKGAFDGRRRYPAALGYWPALGFYMAFITLELFGELSPRGLGLGLLAYSAINLLGAWLVGARDWFRYCELFSVLLRLVGRMAPLAYRRTADGGWAVVGRWPFSGLLEGHSRHVSELVFILFMLSSTAFDGLHATEVWHRLFWEDIRGWLAPWLGGNIVQAYPTLTMLHKVFELAALLVSPFVYLLVYAACLAGARLLVADAPPLRVLMLGFARSLLPIALVYHVSHYYTLVLTQGREIPRLLSDPLGRGWDLLGTAGGGSSGYVPDMDWVWHTQVGLIVAGHIAGVAVAHIEALRLFPDRRSAALSQLPMLLLMLAFTVAGLWILAEPLTASAVPPG